MPTMPDDSLATQALHADNGLDGESDIAPPIHLSTTFRYLYNADQEESLPGPALGSFCYSRDRTPTRTRLETVLSALIRGPTLTYASGLAAVHAYLVFLKPKRIAIGDGYYGSRQVVTLHQQLTGCEILRLDQLDALEEGDVIHLETPINPTGEALSIRRFADEAHKCGAYLVIDSTFGPPGLQDPFALGADIIMHSGTKYFGGHHDLLVLGSMEVLLGLRSLRTLELRVQRQSENAMALARWLDECLKSEADNVVKKTVAAVRHASLQERDMDWLREQMPNGFGPVFAIEMKTEEMSRELTGLLRLFQHATSLGGVESQIEWRKLVDASAKPTLLRVSVGVEYLEDLKRDLFHGFEGLIKD
ncbi:cystathionine gamma-synthase [Aspergillus pseudonomiae]|nr:cystathionine gamma-synthase [Aspergillus pseudonomiae]